MNELTSIADDLRFSLRQMRHAPGFAACAVLTLALGIGVNTAVYSLISGYTRPLPVAAPDRIVVLASEMPGDDTGWGFGLSYPAVTDYRQLNTVFDDVLAFDTRGGGFTANGSTHSFVYQGVTGNYFTGLGVRPHLGRVFAPGEGEALGGDALVVLSYQFWQRRLGSDPSIVGAVVRIDGAPTRVIGIAPQGFHGLYHGLAVEGFVPLGVMTRNDSGEQGIFVDRSLRYLRVAARLKPGVTVAAAQAALDVLSARLQRTYPQERTVTARVIPEPLARPLPMRVLSQLMPVARASMLGLAGLVLLIACMNVANLLLVRGAVRQREMAMRAALGSGRARLIRLLLAESLLLSAAGTLAGLLLARWATAWFARSLVIASDIPLNVDFDFDWRVFAYAAAIAAATGVLMGIAPALRASRAKVSALLHDGGYGSAGAGRQRLRSVMVVAQVAGSVVLLIVAGLCIRTVQRAQSVDLGFDARNVLTVRLDPHQVGYDEPRAWAFYDELERRLLALPGVRSVSTSQGAPMGYFIAAAPVAREGTLTPDDEPRALYLCNSVSPAYFATLGIPIVRGRGFTTADTPTSARAVIINETMARQLFPGEDPVGKDLIVTRPRTEPWRIVGIARDSKYVAVFEGQLPHLYFPIAQDPFYMRIVAIRSAAAPEAMAPLVEREIHALDRDMPIADLRPMHQVVRTGVGYLMFHIGTVQSGAMGILGLLLAVVGVYGVVSYGASLRTREMGIRLALGAAPRDVGALVLRQGSALVIAGVACGLGLAVLVTRAMTRFFVLVEAVDVPTFAAVTILLGSIALAACYLPARRAMRVDPMIALRHE
jgi:putative ABC transport system permease protein